MQRFLRYLWAFPTTCAGLLLLPLACRGGVRRVRGVLELHGPGIQWFLRHLVPIVGGASAMTLGHVIIACDATCLDRSREHEHVHVRQAERWGPLFIPAYLLAALVVRLRGRDAYHDNPFEREAFDKSV